MEVKNSKDTARRMTGMLWGMAGCGKTTLLTSLPGRKLFIMLDPDGKDSIIHNDEIDILDISYMEDDELTRFCTKKLGSFLRQQINKGDDDGPYYTSVVVDSLTTFAMACLNHAIEKGIGKSPRFTPTIEAPGLSAYGARRQYIVQLVRSVLRATAPKNVHCWFTTHQGDAETNDKGDFMRITMMLGGKANNDVGLTLSEIWYMNDADGKRTIAVRACKGREPMKSRLFSSESENEFECKFDIEAPIDQEHSMATWYNNWQNNGGKKIPLPT